VRRSTPIAILSVTAVLGMVAAVIAVVAPPLPVVDSPVSADQAQLVALFDDVEELLREIDLAQESQYRLMRDVEHGLRSPLASIVSLSECLEHGDFGLLTEDQIHACWLIEDTARRLIGQTEVL